MSLTVNSSALTIKARIRQFVMDTFLFGQNGQSLGDEDSFLDGGIIDSTGVLELVGFIESHFHLSIANDELLPDNLDSVDKVATFVSAKLASREAGLASE